MRITILLLFIFAVNLLFGQNEFQDPLTSKKSIEFATDIYLDNQPTQDQRLLTMCSAFNGWLYASYTYLINNKPWISILKSVDNGKNWSVIFSALDGQSGDYYTKIDLIACGNDTSNLKLFFGGCKYHLSSGYHTAFVSRFDCTTNQFEEEILNDLSPSIRDLTLANDLIYPALNSNPYSIALLYSRNVVSSPNKDTLIYCSSSNGGMSLDYRIGVTATNNYISNLDMAYGHSASFPTGKYFIVWQENSNTNASFGHIFTSHSTSSINSPMSQPYMLDTDTSLNNKVRVAAIACQVSATDNNYSNLTNLIICEKTIPTEQRKTLVGFSNVTGATSNDFLTFSVSNDKHNDFQADMAYNPFDTTFMLTFFDSTTYKLPYLTHDVNMVNPDSWNTISSGYNDSTNIKKPYPKIKLDLGQHDGANVWIGERVSGNGIAMFDAPFNFPVGIKPDRNNSPFLFRFFPNPANTIITIEFNAPSSDQTQFLVENIYGQALGKQAPFTSLEGFNQKSIDISDLSPGLYILSIKTSNSIAYSKLIIR